MFRKCHVRYHKFIGVGINPYHEADGLFHEWAQKAFEQSFTYTVGIVELADGTVVTAEPMDIKFEKTQ